MALPEIEYNLHDSTIIAASYDVKGRLELDIQLYEIFYPNKPVVKLIVSGIFNLEKANGLVQAMVSDPFEDDWLGYRVNAFHYDQKRESTKENLYLFLDVEHNKPVNIHCKKINFVESYEIT